MYNQNSMEILLYLAVGAITGVMSGLLGIGGGVIVIPALVWIYSKHGFSPNLVMHMAEGTSLAAMIFTASSSLIGHLRKGVAVWSIYKKLVIGVVIGTIIGAFFSHLLHSNVLEIIFAIFVLLVAIRMLISVQPKPSRKLPGTFGMTIAGLVIGGKSGLLGIGGGAITIPFLSLCNAPVRNTVAVSVATSLTIAIIGTISFMLTGLTVPQLPPHSIGYIYVPGFIGIAITSPIFAQLGANLSHKLPTTSLKKILGAMLLLIAVKMLF